MNIRTADTIIIGGGLCGVYAAYHLARMNTDFIILEARERLGGRILSLEHQNFSSDLGPSWYWPAIHPKMARLVQKLGLQSYQQYDTGFGRFQRTDGSVQTVRGYAMEPPSWRVSGGMAALITKLCEKIPEASIRLNHPVCSIEQISEGVVVNVGELGDEPRKRFHARNVILALPPRLAAATILFNPELSHELTQAMLKIGTWMAGQAKFFAFYEAPFWRAMDLSGQAFSERGPLGEIHDGSGNGRGPYALTGFVGIPAAQRNQHSMLRQAILGQLAALFGQPAAQPTRFFYQDWARERFTATEFDQPPMYQHPNYQPPNNQIAFWNNTIHFAGTETAPQHGGYLEGALIAAERAVANLQKSSNIQKI